MNQNRDDRNALVSFLGRNPERSFRAGALKIQTGVPKKLVHDLLADDSRVTVTEKPKDIFHYQVRKQPHEDAANKDLNLIENGAPFSKG